jgi:hypothetical protein
MIQWLTTKAHPRSREKACSKTTKKEKGLMYIIPEFFVRPSRVANQAEHVKFHVKICSRKERKFMDTKKANHLVSGVIIADEMGL